MLATIAAAAPTIYLLCQGHETAFDGNVEAWSSRVVVNTHDRTFRFGDNAGATYREGPRHLNAINSTVGPKDCYTSVSFTTESYKMADVCRTEIDFGTGPFVSVSRDIWDIDRYTGRLHGRSVMGAMSFVYDGVCKKFSPTPKF